MNGIIECGLYPSHTVLQSIVLHAQRDNVSRIIPTLSKVPYTLMFNHDPVRIRVDGVEKDYPANCCFLWDESHVVYYRGFKPNWIASWLCGAQEVFGELIQRWGIRVNEPILFEDDRLVNRCFPIIYEEFVEYSERDETVILGYIDCLFRELKRAQDHHGRSHRIPLIFLNIRQTATEQLANPGLSPVFLAKRACLETGYFSRKFREYFGMPPAEFIRAERLKLSMQYLRQSDFPIGKIVELSGFHDVFNFSKLFKKKVGMSPRKFRSDRNAVGMLLPPSKRG